MKVELVRIGNSRGIRIPKPIIEQCGFGETVELRVEDHCLVIAAERAPRETWEKAFVEAGPSDADDLLLDELPNQFDQEEWRW
jgi:antitoxin MazE